MSVIVWTKKPCVQCNAVKREFKKHGVVFTELDLTENLEELEAFKANGLSSAPIVQADGHETFAGFDPDAVKAVIASHGVEQ
jgi:glutaredoxin-like protein NrdH